MFSYVGIPFKHLGRDFNGADCFGLVWLYYKHELGIELRDPQVDCTDLLQACKTIQETASKEWQSVQTPQKNDVVLLCTRPAKTKISNHLGVYLGKNRLLHTMEDSGSYIAKVSINIILKSQIRGYLRYAS